MANDDSKTDAVNRARIDSNCSQFFQPHSNAEHPVIPRNVWEGYHPISVYPISTPTDPIPGGYPAGIDYRSFLIQPARYMPVPIAPMISHLPGYTIQPYDRIPMGLVPFPASFPPYHAPNPSVLLGRIYADPKTLSPSGLPPVEHPLKPQSQAARERRR